MAKVGIFQVGDYTWQASLTAALEAAGHTVQVMTNVAITAVPAGSVDLAVFLGGTGNADGASAQVAYTSLGLPVFTQGSQNGPDVLPIQSATPWNEFGGAGGVIRAQLTSPLTTGWNVEPNSCNVCGHVTAVATGVVVLGSEVIGTGAVGTGTYPVYLLLTTSNPGHFWLHYQQPAVPDPAFFQDLAHYVTTNVGVGGPGGGLLACVRSTDCPAGQTCQNGVCVPLGGGGTSFLACTFLGIPCWLAVLLGLLGVYVLTEHGGGRGGGHRRLIRHRAPRVRTRTVIREHRVLVHRKPTLHEAAIRLRRREKELRGR